MSSVLRLTVIAGLTCTAHSLLVTAKPMRTAVTTKKVDTNHAAVQELRKAFDLAPMHHEHEQQASAEKAHRTDFTQWCHSWSERQVTTVPGTVSSHTRRARMPFMMVAMTRRTWKEEIAERAHALRNRMYPHREARRAILDKLSAVDADLQKWLRKCKGDECPLIHKDELVRERNELIASLQEHHDALLELDEEQRLILKSGTSL